MLFRSIMSIAILYKRSQLKGEAIADRVNDMSFSLKRFNERLRRFEHKVIFIDVSRKKLAVYLLKKNRIDVICGYDLCCTKAFHELCESTSFLKIPVIKCDCDDCIDLMLLNHYRKSRADSEIYQQESNYRRSIM